MANLRRPTRYTKKRGLVYSVLILSWLLITSTVIVFLLQTVLVRRGTDQSGGSYCSFNVFYDVTYTSAHGVGPTQTLTTEHIPWRQLVNRYHNVSYVYEGFLIREPGFSKDVDRKAFLKNVQNIDVLNPPKKDALVGRIFTTPNDTVHEVLGCGWNMHNIQHPQSKETYHKKKAIPKRFHILSPFLVPQSNTFQHFIDGVLPKLVQSRDLLRHPNVTLMLYRPWDKAIVQILDRLGIPQKKIAYYEHKRYYKAEYVLNSCITPPLHPNLWETARQLLKIGTSDENTTTFNRSVILILRKKTRNPGRRIVNQDEVVLLLRKLYNRKLVVVDRTLDLADAIRTFQRADIIIGVHGGAMYNIMFARSDAHVIEIMPTDTTGNPVPGHLAHTIIWKMASIIGQTYWRLPLLPASVQGDVNVDTNELLILLARIYKQPLISI